MNLGQLAEVPFASPAPSVPAWSLGCFRRRSITFFDGSTDRTTLVLWLQTRGLTVDLRLSPARPHLSDRSALFACSRDELLQLLQAEAGVAHTRWDGSSMSWHDWVGFQTYVKWPEAGVLRRVGDCLIEFAPSGAYVEDWRLEPAGHGPLIGLSLLEERDDRDGTVVHRGGALVVCGRHAAFVRGRTTEPGELSPIGEARAKERDHAAIERWFDCEASYGVGGARDGGFVVTASTCPWREGTPLVAIDGFEYDRASGRVVQHALDEGRPVERTFAIDTLEPACQTEIATGVTSEGRAWLEAESCTLLRHAQRPSS